MSSPTPAAADEESSRIPRGLLVVLSMASLVVTVAGLNAASGIVGPIFLALVLVIMVHPLRIRLRHHMPDWVASVVLTLAVYALLIGLTLILVVSSARFATLLPTYEPQLESALDNATAWLKDLGVSQSQIKSAVDSFGLSGVGSFVESLLGGLLGVVSNLFLILALVIFMTMDGANMSQHLDRLHRTRPAIVDSVVHFAAGTRTYFLVSTIFGFIVAVIDTAALAWLGIPIPIVWGVLSFITNYIPNVGFVIGLVPPAILGFLEGGPKLGIAVIVVYSLVNVVIQTIIQPKFVGDAVGLSTSITFISLIFWAWTLGALGALLAIPLSLLVKALLIEADPRERWLVPLLSNQLERDDPVTRPPDTDEPPKHAALPPGS